MLVSKKRKILLLLFLIISIFIMVMIFNQNSTKIEGYAYKPKAHKVDSGRTGNVYWEVNSDNVLWFVKYKYTDGVMADYKYIENDNRQWRRYKDRVTEIRFGKGISSGPNTYGMFEGFSKVKKIDFNDFNTIRDVNMFRMFKNMNSLVDINFGNNFYTKNVNSMRDMFTGVKSLKTLRLPSTFDTSRVNDMGYMFNHMEKLEFLYLNDKFYTKNVTKMDDMFSHMYLLKRLILNSNFNTKKATDMRGMFAEMHSLKELRFSGSENFDTSKVTDMRFMFLNDINLVDFNINYLSNFDTRNVTSMMYMFKGAGIEILDLMGARNFDTSKVTDMSYMFAENPNLRILTLPKVFDTHNVTNMSYMFYKLPSLKYLNLSTPNNFDTKKVTNMKEMFSNNVNLETLILPPKMDTRNVTDMSYMFHNMQKLSKLDLGEAKNFDTRNVTDMTWMFADLRSLKKLDLGRAKNFDTRNVITMHSMFRSLRSIKNLDLGRASNFDTRKVTNMFGMFDSLYNLEELDLFKAKNFDTSKVTTMKEMFRDAKKLKYLNLNLAKNFDTRNVTTMENMFQGANIEKIVFPKNFRFPYSARTNEKTPNLISPSGEGLTGKWVKIGGSKIPVTVDQLYRNPWNLTGTWEWHKKKTTDLTRSLQFAGGYHQLPSTISFRLYKNGLPTNTIIRINKSDINSKNGEAELSFGKQDEYKDEAETILNKYTFELAKDLPNFYKVYTGKYKYKIPKINITIEKRWRGGSSNIPDVIEVSLNRNNKSFKSLLLRKNQNWRLMVSNLDRTDKDGRFYNYSIKEITKIEGFKDVVNNFVITNIYGSPLIDFTKTISIKSGIELLPDNLTVDLYKNGKKTGLTQTIGKSEIIANNGSKDVTFKKLPSTDDDGNINNYDIVLDVSKLPAGFKLDEDGNLIFNTSTSSSNEIVVDFGDREDKRPESIAIDLRRKTKVDGSDEWVKTEFITDIKQNIIKKRQDGLPVTDYNGNTYTYYINAPDLNSFNKEVNGLKVKYTYVEKSINISAKIEINGGPKAKKPNPFNITLKNENGEPVDTKPIENGKVKFTVHDNKKYTIDGPNIEGFKKTVDTNTNTITYTFIGDKELVNIQVKVDFPNEDGVFDVKLLKDGEDTVKIKNNVKNGDKPVFKGLPKFDKDGNVIKYTLEKIDPPKAPTTTKWWAC